MRFHILGLPHTIPNKTYNSCAFTQLIIRFGHMLNSSSSDGNNKNTIYFYGHDKSEIECTELIAVTDDNYLNTYYGTYDKNKFIKQANPIAQSIYDRRCITEIQKRKQKNDFILAFWGITNKKITDSFPDCIIVEPGVGYAVSAIYAPYRVFTSYAQMHYAYGKMNIVNNIYGVNRPYDAVIPNYFDINEFEYKNKNDHNMEINKGTDYILYIGRITVDKGIDICIKLAIETKTKLIIAGIHNGLGLRSIGFTDEQLKNNSEYIEFIGHVDVEERKKLLSNAKCLLLPTQYIEPFGNVIIEAGISGTPVITSDLGAFPEIVLHNITGYRCRTFDQYVFALKNVLEGKIKSENCRNWAVNNFSVERVKDMYEEYFTMLYNHHIDHNGDHKKDRKELDWLNKNYNFI